MVRFISLLSLIYTFWIVSDLQAQYYDLFYVDREMTYTIRNVEEEDSAFVFLKPDDTLTHADGVYYYFNRFLDTMATYCPTIPSLVGDSVLLKSDENKTWVFFNSGGDSIFIRSNLSDDEEWVFYTYPDGKYIKARVVLHDNLTIMAGIDDSIFRVRLRVYGADGSDLSDIFPDETKFDISKHFGVTEIYDYLNFPDPSVLHYLRGVSNPDTAITDVDAQSAHTFKPGYEFHYEEFLGGGLKYVHRLYKYFIQSVELSSTNATYTVQRTLWQETIGDGLPPDTLIILDTIDLNYEFSDYSFLDTLELRYILQTTAFSFRHGYSDFIRDTAYYSGVSHKSVNLAYGGYSDTEPCMELVYPPDPQPYFIYGQGLGIMLAKDTGYYAIYPDDTELVSAGHQLNMVYFQQGLITWGEPIDFSQYGFVGTEDLSKGTLKVYPNPAQQFLNFEFPSNLLTGTIRIADMQGLTVIEANGLEVIDVSRLQSGMYVWQILSPDGLYAGTFIKQ
jgi:hypothetical protein